MIISPDFLDHWKTQLLVDKLDGDQSAPLRVIRLWSHCQNRRKNIFPAMTSATLKAVCHYLVDADKLESAMLEAGFIRRDGDMLIVHEWDQYNASLFANWSNGKKGGRPKNKENPRVSDGIPMDNPSGTHQEPIREDKKREEEIEIPASLQTSKFRQAWSEYLDYRKASRLKPLQPASIKAQLLKLSEIGHDTAIEAITNSIANGWQGIHPPKKNHPQTEARKPVVRSI
jgi:hypothetical protein